MSENATAAALDAGNGTYIGDTITRNHEIGKLKSTTRERNRAFLAILVLFVLGVVLAISLAVVVSTRELQTYVVTVDTSSGHVVKTQVATPETVSSTEAIIMSEAHDYVVHRNMADHNDRQRLEDYVATHSTSQVAKEYRAFISSQNPDSPYARMGSRGRQTVKINSIAIPEKGRVQVFFETYIVKDGQRTETKYWQANFAYVFNGKPKLGMDRRWINPLGFLTTNYNQVEQLAKPIAPPTKATALAD